MNNENAQHAAYLNRQVKIGMVAAYKAMLAFKKYKNSPVVISRDGQILHVPAEQMPPAPEVE